jgi:hypothetical protein
VILIVAPDRIPLKIRCPSGSTVYGITLALTVIDPEFSRGIYVKVEESRHDIGRSNRSVD